MDLIHLHEEEGAFRRVQDGHEGLHVEVPQLRKRRNGSNFASLLPNLSLAAALPETKILPNSSKY